MIKNKLKDRYKAIFKSYHDITLKTHIEKFTELDEFLPYNSTFHCITNTQTLAFEFVSKNSISCLGFKPEELKNKGMEFFWQRMHPEDTKSWLEAMSELMKFTLKEIPENERNRMSYTWNYRFKHFNDSYVNIIQNTTPLKFDANSKPVAGLAHYTVVDAQSFFAVNATAKKLNSQKEYETLFFKSYSPKMLLNGITNRERDIVRLLVLGNSSKKIGEKLHISTRTVETHRNNILRKMNVTSTTELIAVLNSNLSNL